MEVMDATNMKPRNDKYSAKVYKYYVEYSDKSSHKKTHTETETHATKAEVRKAFSLHDRGM
jgi:phage/plasmid-associated DNA primase